MEVLAAAFTIEQHKAVKMKFESSLETVIENILARQLIQKLIESKQMQISVIINEPDYNRFEPSLTYVAKLLVDKPK